MICLVQLFDYEAQQFVKGKNKKILECKNCPFKDECNERSTDMNIVDDSMITLCLHFEVHDAEIFGGKGSIGYTSVKVDLKVSALARADIGKYVEKQIQGVAEMCKVGKEKVIVISRTDYEDETEDEEDEDSCIVY